MQRYSKCLEISLKVRELMDKRVSKSKADVVILGGDFNAGPVQHEGIQIIFHRGMICCIKNRKHSDVLPIVQQ